MKIFSITDLNLIYFVKIMAITIVIFGPVIAFYIYTYPKRKHRLFFETVILFYVIFLCDWLMNVVFCWYFSLPLSIVLLAITICFALKNDTFRGLPQNKYRMTVISLGLLFYSISHLLYYVAYRILLGC